MLSASNFMVCFFSNHMLYFQTKLSGGASPVEEEFSSSSSASSSSADSGYGNGSMAASSPTGEYYQLVFKVKNLNSLIRLGG